MSEKKLLDCARNLIRIKQYSIRTERSYLHWMKEFILFHNKWHLLAWLRPFDIRPIFGFWRGSYRPSATPSGLHYLCGGCVENLCAIGVSPVDQ